MFNRKIEDDLKNWESQGNRKPLVLRGARQTGKTTIVRKFGAGFKNLVELNLEKDTVRKIFEEVKDITVVIQSIETIANQKITPGETLLFLDEIQNSPNAIKLLRYFYEELPALHIISAGSLLEVRMKKEGWSFPVGRVEFLYLYPVNFEEFLLALNENITLEILNKHKIGEIIPPAVHDKLIDLLADYIVIGGMPEAVAEYLKSRSFLTVRKLQEALLLSFREDFVKYSSQAEVEYLKLVWDKIPFELGKRIKYSKLGGGNAKTKQIINAFDILHEAMLVERILPTVAVSPPLVKKPKSAPKAIFLDIGLCSFALNLTKEQIKAKLISPDYTGALAEALTYQELFSLDRYNRKSFYFWIREEKGASSELDLLLQAGSNLIPVEVKSGGQGSLKSLHQFLARSKNKIGIRIYNGPPDCHDFNITLPNGESFTYSLLSLPFYLLFRAIDLHREVCG